MDIKLTNEVVNQSDNGFYNVTGQTDNNNKRGMHVSQLENYWVNHSYTVIKDSYGDVVRVKPKVLLKYGLTSNADSGVPTTIMTLQGTEVNETYINTNLIDSVSSSSAANTQPIVIEGHSISGSALTFVVQTVSLNGQNRVPLTTALARATRAFNNGTTALVGQTFVYESVAITAGVPNTASKTHLMIDTDRQQSEKAATAFSDIDYGLVTSMYAGLSRGAGNTVTADIELQVREFGKVFRPLMEITLRSSGSQSELVRFEPYLIVPKNGDIRLVGTSNTNDTQLTGWFNTLIATVQS